MVHPRVAQAVSELWAVLKDLTWRVMNQLAEVPCAIDKNQDWHELTCDGLKPLCRMPNATENFLRVSCQGSSKGLQNRFWAWVEWCWVVNRGKKVLDVYNCQHIYIYIFMYIIYIYTLTVFSLSRDALHRSSPKLQTCHLGQGASTPSSASAALIALKIELIWYRRAVHNKIF